MLVSSREKIRFDLADLDVQPAPRNVLMVDPQHFKVTYVINPYMEGQVGRVDQARAAAQWESVADAYEHLGLEILKMTGPPDLPDMVFCANQTLPGLNRDGRRQVLLSRMASVERQPEVDYFQTFFTSRGYSVSRLDRPDRLEGCGDAIWHHDLRLLWCGHGFRSDPEGFEEACTLFDVTGILLELRDESFYHLDTCLAIVDRETALWVPPAFSSESAGLIERLIPRLIEVPRDEAISLLACNAHSPDGKNVLIQSGCTQTADRLREAGFTVRELDTSEFLKAGGSVFCMKQMVW